MMTGPNARQFTFDISTIMCTSCTQDIAQQLERIVGVNAVVTPSYRHNPPTGRDMVSGGRAVVTVMYSDITKDITAESLIEYIRANTAKNHAAVLISKQDIVLEQQNNNNANKVGYHL